MSAKKSKGQFHWLIVFTMISLFSCSPLAIPGAQAQESATTSQQDLSTQFKAYYEQEDLQLTEEEIAVLKQTKILLIPGYFSDFTIRWTPVGYFNEAKQVLEDLGLKEGADFDRVLIWSQSPAKRNLAIIQEAVEESPKKVMILGHSKGGLDSLKALEDRPELKGKMAGFVSIQSPFLGTEVADVLLNHTMVRGLFSVLLRLSRGHISSLWEFTTRKGRKFLENWKGPWAPEHGPIINFASYLRDGQRMTFPILRPFHSLLAGREIQSDGLVPTQNALLPGCSHIIYEGLDHTDPVVDFGQRGKRRKFLISLLKIMANQVRLTRGQ